MVQIIQSTKRRKVGFHLSFISHMVQIIRGVPFRESIIDKYPFISHMVQIILGLKSQNFWLICLYIPHGSDNTRISFYRLRLSFWSFISHMVQIIRT